MLSLRPIFDKIKSLIFNSNIILINYQLKKIENKVHQVNFEYQQLIIYIVNLFIKY